MSVLQGFENAVHLDYVGCIEMPLRVEDPKDLFDYEPWDVYLGPAGAYLLIHFGPTRIDYVSGDRTDWEGIQQIGKDKNYAVSLWALRNGYEQALELLDKRGLKFQ